MEHDTVIALLRIIEAALLMGAAYLKRVATSARLRAAHAGQREPTNEGQS
jgi:hypothetical protein